MIELVAVLTLGVVVAVLAVAVAFAVERRITRRREEREVDAYWRNVRRDWRKP